MPESETGFSRHEIGDLVLRVHESALAEAGAEGILTFAFGSLGECAIRLPG